MNAASERQGPGLLRIPPFRDSHMHFMIEGRPATAEELPGIRDRYRRCGILSVCDMGHKRGPGPAAKRSLGVSFKVRTAGWALYREGGYGGFIGKAVSGTEEIKSAVAELSDAGADFIKVINSGIVSTRRDEPVTAGGFSPEELRAICREAGERGLRVAAHANSDRSVRDAAFAGVSSIEHGFLISRETVLMMAEAGISWTPTVVGLRNIPPSLHSDEKRYMEGVLDRHLCRINEASAAGVTLKVGTDGGARGVRHGESFFEELRQFRKAGVPLEKIQEAACMPREEVDDGTFLLVRKGFIGTGEIEAIYEEGVRAIF